MTFVNVGKLNFVPSVDYIYIHYQDKRSQLDKRSRQITSVKSNPYSVMVVSHPGNRSNFVRSYLSFLLSSKNDLNNYFLR